MRFRLVFGATVALLTVAGAALLGACGSGACSETLTCDGSSEGGEDSTVDSPPDAGTDVGRDGTLEAELDSAFDGSDAEALDAPDVHDAPVDVVEAAAACGCTPAVPAGFSGPVAFAQEAPASGVAPTPPACASPYTVQAVNGGNDPIFSAPTCTCTCGAVDGGCSVSTVRTFLDNVCVNQCGFVSAPTCTSSECVGESSNSAIVSVPVAMGGACTQSVQKTVPAWNAAQDWGVTGRACATTSTLPEGGCTGTEICAPAPSSAFGTGVCVYQTGKVVACPSTYPNQHVLYSSGTDTRSCVDSCSCGSPTGVSCSVVGAVSTSSTCAGASLLFGDAGSCATFPVTSPPFFVSATVTPSGGSCAPGGSATEAGTVTPTGPTTVCCAN